MRTLNTPQMCDIKQVKDGVAYNTRTSTLLGRTETPTADGGGPGDNGRPKAALEQLFRTRGGRYFIVHRQLPVWTPGHGHEVIDDVEPITKERAIEWLRLHQPDSQDLLFMTLPIATTTQPSAGTSISVRLDASLKEGICMRASMAGQPANALYTLYLRHGFAHHIDRNPPDPNLYQTEDGVPLLNSDGQPAYDGVVDNGTHFEMFRAETAAVFRTLAHTIPERLRYILVAAIAGPDSSVEEHKRIAMREALLSDIERWLKLLSRPIWS